MNADVAVLNAGSLVIITPITEEAQQWCEEHLPADAPMLGNGYAVEPRYAPDILLGMSEDGLLFEGYL
jgi:hypothetical protein